MSDARAALALRDIDRSVSSLRLRTRIWRWLYVPLLSVALVAMVVGVVLGRGERWPMVGGAVGLVGAVSALLSGCRRQEDEIADLEAERDELLSRFPETREP